MEESQLTSTLVEQTPMNLETFKEHIKIVSKENQQKLIEDFDNDILHLRDYSGVHKFKSIRRAIKRGLVSIYGEVYPKRPFKNIKRGKGSVTYNKKRLYEQLTHKNCKCN